MSNGLTGKSLYVVDVNGKTKVRIDVPVEGIIQAPVAVEETIHLDGKNAAIILKVDGKTKIVLKAIAPEGVAGLPDASISLRGPTGQESISLQADGASLTLRDAITGKDRIFFDSAGANVYIGGNDVGGDLFLYPKAGNFRGSGAERVPSLQLSGDKGDIILANADCAEEFDIIDEAPVDPGTVMVIHADGKLAQSVMPYDKRVAGVVAGAAGHRPGIILGKQLSNAHRLPIGLLGRVSCKVDADYGPITVGDLLTTSPTPGHAMKATDPSQAFGAVLGKAMAVLAAGRELLPILIALQ